jgi:hypothetical protein
MENKISKRVIFMISGAMDSILGAVALLIYFDVLLLDLDIPRWILGLVGALLFFSGIMVFAYLLSKPENE